MPDPDSTPRRLAWWFTPRLATEVPRHAPSYHGPAAVMGRQFAWFARSVGLAFLPVVRSLADQWRDVIRKYQEANGAR